LGSTLGPATRRTTLAAHGCEKKKNSTKKRKMNIKRKLKSSYH